MDDKKRDAENKRLISFRTEIVRRRHRQRESRLLVQNRSARSHFERNRYEIIRRIPRETLAFLSTTLISQSTVMSIMSTASCGQVIHRSTTFTTTAIATTKMPSQIDGAPSQRPWCRSERSPSRLSVSQSACLSVSSTGWLADASRPLGRIESNQMLLIVPWANAQTLIRSPAADLLDCSAGSNPRFLVRRRGGGAAKRRRRQRCRGRRDVIWCRRWLSPAVPSHSIRLPFRRFISARCNWSREKAVGVPPLRSHRHTLPARRAQTSLVSVSLALHSPTLP